MLINSLTLKLSGHHWPEIVTTMRARTLKLKPGSAAHAKAESACLALEDALSAALKVRAADADRRAYWEAHPELNFGEVNALTKGNKIPFWPGRKTPVRRGDTVRMDRGTVAVSRTFAYVTDDGRIATQELGEDPIIWKASDFRSIEMIGRDEVVA